MLKYIISVVLSSTLFTASIAETSEPANKVKKKGSKLAKVYGIDRPFWTPNRIGNYITNNGQLVSHIPTGSEGMEWPLGSGNHINFASGLWLAGMKDGEIEKEEVLDSRQGSHPWDINYEFIRELRISAKERAKIEEEFLGYEQLWGISN